MAMGKRFAQAYANIYMAQWEELFFSEYTKLPFVIFRVLDDVWGMWEHGHNMDFESFLERLNSHHSSIKVRVVLDEWAVVFLDTTMYKGPGFVTSGKLDFKVFFKDTDTNALLHYHSYHPCHTFRALFGHNYYDLAGFVHEIKIFRRLKGSCSKLSRVGDTPEHGYGQFIRSIVVQAVVYLPSLSQRIWPWSRATFTFSPGARSLIYRGSEFF